MSGTTFNVTDRPASGKGMTTVEVFSPDDLPTPSGGVIPLAASTMYLFKTSMTLSNPLQLPAVGSCRLEAEDATNTAITFDAASSTAIQRTTGAGTARIHAIDFTITGSNSQLFGLVAGTINISQVFALFLGTGTQTIGTMDADLVVMENMQMVFPNAGLTVTSADNFTIDRVAIVTNISNPGTGTMISLDALSVNAIFSQIDFVGNSNETLFDFASTITSRISLFQVSLSGGGTYYDATGLDQTSIHVNSLQPVGSPRSRNIGSLVVNSNGAATTIATQSTFTDLNLDSNAVAGGNIEQWTLTNTTTGELTYNGIEDFAGLLVASISANGAGGSSEYHFRAVINGSPASPAPETALDIGSSLASAALVCPVSVVTGDTVRLQVENTDNTSDITVVLLTVNIEG